MILTNLGAVWTQNEPLLVILAVIIVIYTICRYTLAIAGRFYPSTFNFKALCATSYSFWLVVKVLPPEPAVSVRGARLFRQSTGQFPNYTKYEIGGSNGKPVCSVTAMIADLIPTVLQRRRRFAVPPSLLKLTP